MIADFRQVPKDPSLSTVRPVRSIGDTVEQLMVKYQIGRSSPEQTIRDRWAELVGTPNASYSHAVSIERGRLLVLVTHAVVRNELFQHREPIVQKIRALPGCQDVRSLNLRSG